MDENELLKALNELDQLLFEKQLSLNILICGAFAIQLHGFSRSNHTLDVDTLIPIDQAEVLEAIEQIGKKFGLGKRWLNDQVTTVSAPPKVLERATSLSNWKSINAYLVARIDLIKLKASAFSIRREHTIKDWEDLVLLKPTAPEIKAAIDFLKMTNSPPEGASKSDFNNFRNTIDDLKKLAQ